MNGLDESLSISQGLIQRKRKAVNKVELNENCNHEIPCHHRSKTYYVLAAGTLVLIIAGVIIVHITSAVTEVALKSEPPDPEVDLPPSSSVLRKFRRGAVCSDGTPCSSIGRAILLQNGSAVDAALATLFCNGLVNCHSMGLAGGFLMTVYQSSSKRAYSLNARETAPAAATEEMFHSDSSASRSGVLSVAVPGELAGYWAAHERFGKLPWRALIEPTIVMCKEGYNMTKHQYDALKLREEVVTKDPLLKEVFVDPSTGELLRQGSRVVQSQYCKTLEVVAKEGARALYNGSLAQALVQDIQGLGGIITLQDLKDYRVRWDKPIRVRLRSGDSVLSCPPPGSGVLLAFILNLLEEYNLTASDISTVTRSVATYHRMVETFKFAYAKRTQLADPEFVDIKELISNLTSKTYAAHILLRINDTRTFNEPEYYGAEYYVQDGRGTAHVSVISSEGDAVSVTSSINLYFGAGVTSKSTGIILNSGMDDFSFPSFDNYFGLPGSPANKIEPGKRPMSSMSPTILLDSEGGVRMVVGGAGGTSITTGVAYVIMRHLWFGEDLKKAIDASRLHHQLLPMQISYEYGILKDIVSGLEKLGHKMQRCRGRGSVICAVAKIGDYLFANADYRKAGDVYGID